MPDVPACIGVPVWKYDLADWPYGCEYAPIPPPERSDFLGNPLPGLWFASTPEAVAEMRALLCALVNTCDGAASAGAYNGPEPFVEDFLRALGFTDG